MRNEVPNCFLPKRKKKFGRNKSGHSGNGNVGSNAAKNFLGTGEAKSCGNPVMCPAVFIQRGWFDVGYDC